MYTLLTGYVVKAQMLISIGGHSLTICFAMFAVKNHEGIFVPFCVVTERYCTLLLAGDIEKMSLLIEMSIHTFFLCFNGIGNHRAMFTTCYFMGMAPRKCLIRR